MMLGTQILVRLRLSYAKIVDRPACSCAKDSSAAATSLIPSVNAQAQVMRHYPGYVAESSKLQNQCNLVTFLLWNVI